MDNINVLWLRRDLRFEDNTALNAALEENLPVLPIFIFDSNILSELERDDARISFIYQTLKKLNLVLKTHGSSLKIEHGKPIEVFQKLVENYTINKVFVNRDYEPYSKTRDQEIHQFLAEKNIQMVGFKDHVIFEKSEITKHQNEPYVVFSHYKKRWLENLLLAPLLNNFVNFKQFYKADFKFISLRDLGFRESKIKVPDYDISDLHDYVKYRDFPALEKTSKLSTHLRFGTISIRHVLHNVLGNNMFVSELIWRDFFIQVLYHSPESALQNFKPKYNNINWLNNDEDFEKWCNGQTGYPLVDAGMNELNQTGYMHNRVRMVTAGFLTKHLLIDWRWGEAYFAKKLLDFDLAANVGNWQWAAGTGCDAAPYFRIFNPTTQLEKFDQDYVYVKKWIPDFDKNNYLEPMVEHKFARQRALETYKTALNI